MEYVFDKTKNEVLKEKRGISFEEIIELLGTRHFLGAIPNPNQKKYPGQEFLEVEIGGYVWRVPCKIGLHATVLKTAYPSRKATKKRGQHEKN